MRSMKILIISIILCLFINVRALTYTEEEVVNKINSSKVKVNELLGDLISWSDTNSSAVKIIVTREFVNSINTLDFETNLNKAINKLKSNGEIKAASDLEKLKPKLLINYDDYVETLNITKKYLEERKEYGVNGNLDVFIAIREFGKFNKTNLSKLVKIYYNYGFDYIYNNLDNYNIEDIIDEFDYIYELDIINILFNKSDEFMTIYNDYHLEDYDDVLKDYFGTFYNSLKKDYYRIYDELENRYQIILDKKIKDIVDNTDVTNDLSITIRNNKLYDLINDIDLVSDKLNTRFNNINSKIKIDTMKKYIKEYQSEAINRFSEASNYVKSYIIDNIKLEVKNELDKKDILIDMTKDMIVYHGTNLDISIIDKLISNYGYLKAINLYNNNFGTGSKVQIINNDLIVKDFTFIVKGDVNPSGKIDISDVVKVANKMFDKIELGSLEVIAADMNDDNKIDITDIVLLCKKIFN